ncbi:MAG: HIT family protein [Candidatus Saccharimonas sp.]
MKYVDYLKTQIRCPFCYDIERRTLIENDGAILTYAQAPYHKYHLIVIPKRHVENIKDLSWSENISITALLVSGIKALDKIGHNDCSILVRDANAPQKSVKHLHYHIIPGGYLEDVSINCEVRKLLSDEDEMSLIKELKEITN